MLDADKLGYFLWEGITLLFVILGGIGLLVLRRKSRGEPSFTTQDYELFFGRSKTEVSHVRAVATFGLAVVFCGVIEILAVEALAPLGPGLLTPVLVLSYLAIVYRLSF